MTSSQQDLLSDKGPVRTTRLRVQWVQSCGDFLAIRTVLCEKFLKVMYICVRLKDVLLAYVEEQFSSTVLSSQIFFPSVK
jgi:hypothetical protein